MSYINPGDKPPTEKQLRLISEMEDWGIYKFEGSTIEDAKNYISENYELFKEQKKFMS